VARCRTKPNGLFANGAFFGIFAEWLQCTFLKSAVLLKCRGLRLCRIVAVQVLGAQAPLALLRMTQVVPRDA